MKRKTVDLLPVYFRTDSNEKFLSGTIDQLIQQPSLKKVDGFIGSRFVSNFDSTKDSYLNGKDSVRDQFELEPSIVLRNAITDQVEYVKTYEDILNAISYFGGSTANQNRLFKQQSYAWNPHIDWDKFVNFRNYIWAPNGPEVINVTGPEKQIVSTIKVKIVSDDNGNYWSFSTDGVAYNPTITLYRGLTYIFEVDAGDQTFYVKTRRTSSGSVNALEGVVNNGTSLGNVVFEVKDDAPATLFYVSGEDNTIFGKFLVRDLVDSTTLDVEKDLLNKKTFTFGNGTPLSNGMRVTFSGSVVPESYKSKTYVVEGVGSAIKLVDIEQLVTIENYGSILDTNFDQTSFDELPFDSVSNYPLTPDYITINVSSKDLNPWSRYNRWVHIDVLTVSAELNGSTAEIDFSKRAQRPIIEFKPDIQLYNFGTTAKKYVDFLDTTTADAFSTIEGSAGFYVDGYSLQEGNRIIFLADTDSSVKNKTFVVRFLNIEGVYKIHLEQAVDFEPQESDSVLIVSGKANIRRTLHFKNGSWVNAQAKTSVNQAPLFEIYNSDSVAFSDENVYQNTTYTGNRIFGYQVGTGTNDSILGFPLVYNNVSNVGAYLYDMDLFNQSYSYLKNKTTVSYYAKDGFIKVDGKFNTAWTPCDTLTQQLIVDQAVALGGESYVEFNSIDINTPSSDIDVYKNNTLLPTTAYSISFENDINATYINFTSALAANDVIVVKVQPTYTKLSSGQYEPPSNLTNNPMNACPTGMSFAEIIDHLNSITDNANITDSQLRDTADVEKYGRRFLQHDGIISLAGLFLTDKEFNIVNSLRWAGQAYQKFRLDVLQRFAELPSYASVQEALDKILIDISKENNINTPFYYSDMMAYGLNRKVYSYTVKNTAVTSYALGTEPYNNEVISTTSVLVYINGEQKIYGVDYSFDTVNPLVKFLTTLAVDDVIEIKVYPSTNGLCMPASPTKLGLYPAFKPSIYLDDTYITPTNVIQCHDGSLIVAYGDDRDTLILEIENRIYNNLKIKYDPTVFDLNLVTPGRFRKSDYALSDINQVLENEFLRWSGFYNIDYTTNDNAIYENEFGFNYPAHQDLIDGTLVYGSWRHMYKFYYDTDRPHTCPWEMLGFTEKPTWWEDEYGPAPYTFGNKVLWEDLSLGRIRQGAREGYDALYARPSLLKIIPVDDAGNLKTPLEAGIISNFDTTRVYDDWEFGDIGPAENAWRRSSLFPFAVQICMALNMPAKYTTLGFDVSRRVKNLAGQFVYAETNERVEPNSLVVAGTKVNNQVVLGIGYHTYIVDYVRQRYSNAPEKMQDLLNRLSMNLAYKVGGFTSKDKFKISLETVTSYKTVDNIFVPEENYQIALNVSTPIKTLAISAVIVERGDTGFIVKGYDKINPYFTTLKPQHQPNDKIETVGGISEPFIYWSQSSNIAGGTIVANGNKYYRAIANHITKTSFDISLYYPLPYLPTTGGVEVAIPQKFETTETVVPYGHIFHSTQDVYDFLVGYGKWLETQGFEFTNKLEELQQVANWDLAGKEFLYWSLQRWAVNSIISLAPFSANLVFNSSKSVVDNIYDKFYDYNLLKSDSFALESNKVDISRAGSKFSISTARIPNDGVYYAKINLVQKEHILVLDNKTVFNDLIYSPTSGYRQRRFKIKGFMTDGWDGDFFVPGFVYDDAKIDDWQQNVDYHIGDVVKYQTNYYQATSNLLAADTFDYANWSLLGAKPVAQLLPNFEYKIQQFEDFYSLDGVSFDASQQKFAQKLVGYVPRPYLNALIPDETSQYKFYQGFIKEKGTIQPLEKFAVANNSSMGTHVSLDEEWAIRLGTFGGENSYKEIEFTLDQDKFGTDPQIFEFVTDKNANNNRTFKLTYDEIITKPEDFDGTPWPTLDVDPNNGNSFDQYVKMPVAGYARIDDVTYTSLYSNNILTLSQNTALSEGDTVWVAMDTTGNWDVKRYTLSAASIINYGVDNDNQLISFNTDLPHNLKVRDFVSVTRLDDPLNGVYEVLAITAPETFVVKTTLNDLPGPTDVLNGSLFTFASSRFATKDDLADLKGLARWQDCEFVWVDDMGDGTWAVLEREKSTVANPVRPYLTTTANQNFGSQVVVGKYSDNIIVSATGVEKGRVYIYKRNSLGIEDLSLLQSYLLDENAADLLTVQNRFNSQPISEIKRDHGKSLSVWESSDLTKRYIVSGAPGSSNAKWLTVGQLTPPARKVLNFNYNISGLLREGAIKIAKYDTTSELYVTDVVLASPIAQANSYFGFDVKFAGTTTPLLFVSAPGQDNKIGEVFVYFLDDNSQWQVYTLNNTPYRLRSEITNINVGAEFGWDISLTNDAKTLAISAPGYVNDLTSIHAGAVFIFTKDAVTNAYTLTQTIKADDYLQATDLSLKGTTKTYTTVDTALMFSSLTNSLTRNIGSFITDGFRLGQKITISGTTDNNGDYVISELYPLKMVFSQLTALIDEEVSNAVTIVGQGTRREDRFGDSLSLSGDGSVLIISSDHASTDKFDSGLVYVFSLSNGQYALEQRISSPSVQTGELFGSNTSLSDDGRVLLIGALGGGQESPMYFDNYLNRIANSTSEFGSEYVLDRSSSLNPVRTTFDGGTTRFVTKIRNAGSVYLYQRLDKKFFFGEMLNGGDTAEFDEYGTGLYTNGTTHYVGSPKYDMVTSGTKYLDAGTMVIFDKKQNCGCGDGWSWTVARVQEPMVDSSKIKKVITYNNQDSQIIDYYDIFDPIKGRIPHSVANEIKYMTPYDPAVYTVAVNSSTKVRVDNKTTWSKDHVGELWLDLSTLRYVWYEQGSQEFRDNNWGKLFPGATVDVYEWVESDYRPSEWSQLADTTEGLALGISGQPKNPDNSVVSVNQYFDPVINDFVNVYYFWVRNKTTLPALNFRSISGFECSRLIEDPKGQGIKYAAFLSSKSLSLANSKQKLNANKININVFYDEINNEVNRHSQWQLINENSSYLSLDSSFETKLFDSLVGQDKKGNLVPDPALSPKMRQGNLFRPRQSWFKNREGALKTLINYTNDILSGIDIVGKIDLTNLEKVDGIPLEYLGRYDQALDLVEDLIKIGVNNKVTAELTATVVNGRLTNVTIDNPGYGYAIAPTVKIIGSGSGAQIQTAIDQLGRVTGVTIVRQGSGYLTAPTMQVRPYSVLINYDEEIGKWAIYHLDIENKTFDRFTSQTFDVTKYWDYIDWRDARFVEGSTATHVVDFVSELDTETFAIGDTVEIRNPGDGKVVVVQRVSDGTGNAYPNFDLVYRQNGTIQFSNLIYDRNASGFGFDNLSLYDQLAFDESNAIEIRAILEAIKNDIFVRDLAHYWSKFFFVALRYVLSEQPFVDWLYKTSYITPKIDAGTLDQEPIYRVNDFTYVEEFVKEIKPFRSKMRDITVAQNADEQLSVGVTDFDLPPYLDTRTNEVVVPSETDYKIRYPFKHWYLNYGFGVDDIEITNTGANFVIPPIITIVPAAGDFGSGATAVAYISEGKLSRIMVTNPGNGYTKTPTIVISGGGNYTSTFVAGSAYARLSNKKVRNNQLTMKFDRTSELGLYTGEKISRNITTDGIRLYYVLSYPVTTTDTNYPAFQDETQIKLFLDGAEIPKENYRITFKDDLSTIISFNVALPADKNLRIDYIKNTLYSVDSFTQSSSGSLYDTFKLTFAPELDKKKIIIKVIDPKFGTGYDVPITDYVVLLRQELVSYNKYTGYIKFKEPPAEGTVITVQYAKNVNIQNAVDRVINYYNPLPGMPGKDLSQLMKGVEFGGVEIQGLNFTVSSGWDGLPWFTQGWDTFANENQDLLVIGDGTTATYQLGYVPLVNSQINVYFNGVRVDDINFGTLQQTNENALFKTIVADGINDTITLPVVPANSTKIAIRLSISDGVILPTDDSVLDTKLSGGDFTTYVDVGTVRFKTASGIRADDILVDGGGFISKEHSPATEELIKGEIFDTVSISVFNSPSVGSNFIDSYQFVLDGVTTTFDIDKVVVSLDQVDVYIGNSVAVKDDDFTVEQLANGKTRITLLSSNYTPNIDVLTIQAIGIGGSSILYKTSYLTTSADAALDTIEITTPVKYGDVGSFYATVAGEVLVDARINSSSVTLQKVAGRSARAKIVIDNSVLNIPADKFITIILFATSVKTYTEKYTQEIEITTGVTSYALTQPPGTIAPLHVMAIVTRDGNRLMPPETEYFDITRDNQTIAFGDNITYLSRSLSGSDVEVYVNGKMLTVIRDYTFNSANNSVTINPRVAQVGDVAAVSVIKSSNYLIQGTNIVFRPSSNIQVGEKVYVTTFTNHDSNLMRREIFEGNELNEYKVSRPIYNINNTWVDVNGEPLVPNYEYSITSDGSTVTLSDKYSLVSTDRVVITSISDIVSSESIAYRIFKDMANNSQYKRLSRIDSTVLTKELKITDTEIEIADASIFGVISPTATKPGVLFIAGERIEFFSITDNKLSRLTRGTRGTGPMETYPVGTRIYNAGESQTVPYRDGMISQTLATPANYRFNDTSSTYEYQSSPGVWTTAPSTFSQFTLTNFMFKSEVAYGNQVQVYLAGRPLLKPTGVFNPHIKHDFSITYDSNETNSEGVSGDVIQDPDFTVTLDGSDYILTINPNVLPRNPDGTLVANVQIKVLQKIGKIWYSPNSEVTLQQESSVQGQFLQTSPAELPDKYYYGKQ